MRGLLRGTRARSGRRVWFFLFCAMLLFILNIHLIYINIEDYPKATRKIGSFLFGKGNFDQSMKFYTPGGEGPLTCNMTLEYAKKSVRRAKTSECQRKIKDAACKLQNGQLYPMKLSRLECPLADRNAGKYLGCYPDSPERRILTGHKFEGPETNTPEECVESCLRIGYQVAGVEYGMECFCGDMQVVEETEELHGRRCREYECPGDPSLRCGGFNSVALYNTGLGNVSPELAHYIEANESESKSIPPTRIAFLLQFNGRAVRQVKRLIKLIYRPHHFYYVHVDARQHYMYREMKKLEADMVSLGMTNFRVKEHRFVTLWGGASLLEMILDAVGEMLEMWSEWTVTVNLSEADFFLLSLEEMERFLAAYPGRSFLRSHGKATQKFIHSQGLDRAFIQCENRMWRVGDRELPKNVRFDGGSDWVGLHREFADFAVHSKMTTVSGLKQFYHYTLLPAESFFHTLASNTRFCNKIVNSNLKLTNWKRKVGCKCQYKHIVDWCGCSPSVFVIEETKRLQRPNAETRLHFTARKFEAIIDQQIIDFAEMQSLGPERNEKHNHVVKSHESWGKYWQNDYHFILDIPPSSDYSKIDSNLISQLNAVGKESNQAAKLVLMNSVARLTCDKQHADQESVVDANHDQQKENSINGLNNKHLNFSTIVPLELNIHAKPNSHFTSTLEFLVKFKVSCSENEYLVLETRVTRKPRWKLIGDESVLGPWRLMELDVGTEFDLKEEIFRNYPGAFGPTSSPSLRHRWEMIQMPESDPKLANVNLTLLNTVWRDTFGKVRYTSPLDGVSRDHMTRHTDMEAGLLDRAPMRPGVWSVELKHGDHPVAFIEFPIYPSTTVASPHGGLNKQALTIADQLTMQFYQMNEICMSDLPENLGSEPIVSFRNSQVNNQKDMLKGCPFQWTSNLPKCRETVWSSEFPDLKSDISVGFDPAMGILV